MNLRLRHDLDERRAGAIEIDGGGVREAIVHGLPGVLLHVHAMHADCARWFDRVINDDGAAGRDGLIELRDLISLRQIRIEVVLAGEHRRMVHGTAECEGRARGKFDGVRVKHR